MKFKAGNRVKLAFTEDVYDVSIACGMEGTVTGKMYLNTYHLVKMDDSCVSSRWPDGIAVSEGDMELIEPQPLHWQELENWIEHNAEPLSRLYATLDWKWLLSGMSMQRLPSADDIGTVIRNNARIAEENGKPCSSVGLTVELVNCQVPSYFTVSFGRKWFPSEDSNVEPQLLAHDETIGNVYDDGYTDGIAAVFNAVNNAIAEK